MTREDFDGVEMWSHRGDLIDRLDQVPGRLNWGMGPGSVHPTDNQLENAQHIAEGWAPERGEEGSDHPNLYVSRVSSSNQYTNFFGHLQDLSRPSIVAYLSRARDVAFGIFRIGVARPPRIGTNAQRPALALKLASLIRKTRNTHRISPFFAPSPNNPCGSCESAVRLFE